MTPKKKKRQRAPKTISMPQSKEKSIRAIAEDLKVSTKFTKKYDNKVENVRTERVEKKSKKSIYNEQIHA